MVFNKRPPLSECLKICRNASFSILMAYHLDAHSRARKRSHVVDLTHSPSDVITLSYSDDDDVQPKPLTSSSLPFDESALARDHEQLYDNRGPLPSPPTVKPRPPARVVSPFLTHGSSDDDATDDDATIAGEDDNDDVYSVDGFNTRFKPARAPSPHIDDAFGEERPPAPLLSHPPPHVIAKDAPTNFYKSAKTSKTTPTPRNLIGKPTSATVSTPSDYPAFFTPEVLRSPLFKRLVGTPQRLSQLAATHPFAHIEKPFVATQSIVLSEEERKLSSARQQALKRERAEALLNDKISHQTQVAFQWLHQLDKALAPLPTTTPAANPFPHLSFEDLLHQAPTPNVATPADLSEQLAHMTDSQLHTEALALGVTPPVEDSQDHAPYQRQDYQPKNLQPRAKRRKVASPGTYEHLSILGPDSSPPSRIPTAASLPLYNASQAQPSSHDIQQASNPFDLQGLEHVIAPTTTIDEVTRFEDLVPNGQGGPDQSSFTEAQPFDDSSFDRHHVPDLSDFVNEHFLRHG